MALSSLGRGKGRAPSASSCQMTLFLLFAGRSNVFLEHITDFFGVLSWAIVFLLLPLGAGWQVRLQFTFPCLYLQSCLISPYQVSKWSCIFPSPRAAKTRPNLSVDLSCSPVIQRREGECWCRHCA